LTRLTKRCYNIANRISDLRGRVQFPIGGIARERAAARRTRWNSGADGYSPDERRLKVA
jgi:hypothetical protein